LSIRRNHRFRWMVNMIVLCSPPKH
jgi:hypothetical protein